MRGLQKTIIRHGAYACEVIIAKTLLQRLRGLLFRPNWRGGLMMRGNSVHTFGMTAPIDVLFLDRKGEVIRIASHLKPWRLSPIVWKAAYIVEVPTGRFRSLRTGDTLQLYHF